jgi:branched-chain amino acid transport system substrate-binding protein
MKVVDTGTPAGTGVTRRVSGLGAAVMIAGLVTGLASGPASAAEVLIAAELALTGPYAFAGVPTRDALVMTIEDINARKLAGEHTIRLQIEDTASDKQQAISLANRFAARDGAVMILGPSSSLEAVAVAPVANALKVPMLTTTALAEDITKAGEWSFKTPESPKITVEELTKYAVEKMQVKRVALVFGRDNEGQIAQKNVARDYFKAHGVEVASEESVLTSDTDFQGLITKLESLNVDTIFLTPVAEQAANLIVQARQGGLGPELRFIGTSNMGSERFLRVGGAAVEGATFFADYFHTIASADNTAFVAAFRARYKRDPDNVSALGFTALHLAARAIAAAGPNPTRESVRAALAATRDVPVILGKGRFGFDEGRNPHYGQVILTVKNGQFAVAP